jgi:Raf kinase inhibitor-like YbhB/YbcL family protein
MCKRSLVASSASRVSSASSRPRLPHRVIAFLIAAASAIAASRALAEEPFTVSSTDLRAGGTVNAAQVFDQDECTGGNRSPQLSWHGAPAGTRSFAVTMFDLDAPGPGWWHWATADIPAGVSQLPTNASASGFLKKLGAVEASNDFGRDGYGGPCPPPGKPHRYVVTVYALSVASLRVGPGRPAQMFDHEIGTVALGSARLVVNYGR